MKCQCSSSCKVDLFILKPKREVLGEDFVEVSFIKRGILGFKESVIVDRKELIKVLSSIQK